MLSFTGLIIASVLKKPETNDINDKLIEKQRDEKIKNERKENARVILINELELLKKNNRESDNSKAPSKIVEYLLLSESYDFEAENLLNKKAGKKLEFEVSLIDSSKGIYDIIDSSNFGKGECVKFCKGMNKNLQINDGTILNKLIKIDNGKSEAFNLWEFNNVFDYIISPRIRIDPVFASNFENSDYPVCQIVVMNSLGDTILDRNIYVKDFYDEGTINYDGSYRTEYDVSEIKSIMRLSKNQLFKNKNAINKNPFINIEIFYYGFCDMWIDYVRVENEVGYYFLTKQDASLIKKLEDFSGRNILQKLYGFN